MKNKPVVILAAAVMLLGFLLGLSGLVSLAGKEVAGQNAPDQLIGLLVTMDYLDLPDMDALVREQGTRLVSGQDLNERDFAPDRGRLYAKLVSEDHPAQGGGTVAYDAWVFEGVEGFAFYVPEMTRGEDRYRTNRFDPPFGEVSFSVDESEGKTAIDLKGTLWIAADSPLDSLYMNPVYQAADGRVYAVTGNGMSFDYSLRQDGYGMQASMAVDENTSRAPDGNKEEYAFHAEVFFRSMPAPREITLTQFDSAHAVLASDTWKAGEVPNTIRLPDNCAYLVAERLGKGEETPRRELLQAGDTLLTTYVERPDGLCEPLSSGLEWAE